MLPLDKKNMHTFLKQQSVDRTQHHYYNFCFFLIDKVLSSAELAETICFRGQQVNLS